MSVGHRAVAPSESLEGRFPGAVVRLVSGPDGIELIDANRKASMLLAAPIETLIGAGFIEGLFDDDARVLAGAVAEPGAAASPFVLRWGTTPPVNYIGVDLLDGTDGTILAALHDLSDQYRLDAILAGQSAWLQIFDQPGFVTWVSAQTTVTLGVSKESFIGMHSTDIVHPDDFQHLLRASKEMSANPGVEVVVWYRICDPATRTTRWTACNFLTFLPDDPAIGGVTSIATLVLEAGDGSTGLDELPDHRSIAEMMPSGLILASRDRIHFRNGRARRMLGSSAELPGPYQWIDAIREEHRESVRAAVEVAMAAGHRNTVTAALGQHTGGTVWVRIEAMPSFDVAGNHVGYAATLLDITAEHSARQQMQQTQGQLWHMANHDGLTDLPNRMQFHDRLDQALARTRREGRSTAVLFCDVDHFKQVNDEHGHAAGDKVLVEIAGRFTAALRETDTVCRLGGDEFVVICEGFERRAGVGALAQRLIDAINRPVSLGEADGADGAGCTANLGLCVGIAIADATSTADELLALADSAAYRAKQSGRNGYFTAPVAGEEPVSP